MSIKNERVIYAIMFLLSIILIIFCSLELINSMVTYKYHFEDYSEDVYKIISYKSRKMELETIISYISVFTIYLLLVVIFFFNKSLKSNIKTLVIIVSMLFIVFCFYELINYAIEYKDKIRTNLNQSDIIVSYKQSKMEIELIIRYLKIFIIYLLTITSYISYKLFSRSA